MTHSEILEKLDALISLSGTIDPFGTVDLALVALRFEISAATLVEEAKREADYLVREDYHHACAYISF